MMNHDNFFNTVSRQLELSYLFKARSTVISSPTKLNLASGLPTPELFPFKEATFTMKDGQVLHIPQHLMEVALQYGEVDGFPELIEQLRALIAKLLAPPHMAERRMFVTAGACDAIYTILHTFVDPGDYVFTPENTYPIFNNALKTTEAKPVSVPSDSDGIRPDMLREALKNSSDGRRKLLYVVPHGDNPTGSTLSKDRQQEIYSLACEYDFLIVEDDAYYFLHYGSEVHSSFLSLDTEGRVIRIDTFAKIMGGGVRIGFVTADKYFIEKMLLMHSTILNHTSSFTQVIISELLRCLGHEGFMEMTKRNSKMYRDKRDVALQAATKHLTGLCEWKELDGMFLWLKVLGLEDVTEMVVKHCTEKDLVLVPGSEFMFDKTQPCPYIRMSFSLITPEKADKGFQILADVIKEELKKTRAPEN